MVRQKQGPAGDAPRSLKKLPSGCFRRCFWCVLGRSGLHTGTFLVAVAVVPTPKLLLRIPDFCGSGTPSSEPFLPLLARALAPIH